MRRAVRVVFDANNIVRARFSAVKVDDSYSAFMTTTSGANSDLACVVSPSLFAQRKCEVANGFALPKMRVDEHSNVSQARCDWFKLLEAVYNLYQRVCRVSFAFCWTGWRWALGL